MKNRYFVSVSVDGKIVDTYYSELLGELIVTRAIHKGCKVTVFDLEDFRTLPPSEIKALTSGDDASVNVPIETARDEGRKKSRKRKKYWNRSVMCVETGEVFPSIRSCCEKMGMSHKTVWNALNSGNDRNGYHFVNVPSPKEKKNS